VAPDEAEIIARLLEALTGQRAPLPEGRDGISSFPKSGLGYSQLNELLLLFGYDRVTRTFFQFLADGTLDYKPGCAIRSIEEFQTGVERARQLSLLFFGNVKFGFKKFGRDADELRFYHDSTQPVDEAMFKNRHDPIHPVDPIPLHETYYLGYLIQKEINDQLAKNPNDDTAIAARRVQERVVEKGIHNQHAYLVSDHLDVYVATSMRRKHEYVEVAQFTNQLFNHVLTRDLKLRWFDPTQAYCADRIDKGLAEALMLKRAKCTLYLAQESDTLGKDSELASTLAQGKPVIAYVPSPTEEDVVESVTTFSVLYGKSESLVILERLQAFSPNLAWENPQVRQWLDAPDKVDNKEALKLLVKTAQGHYARRADMLRESNPLGIQVNLDTGVANGVLVVRTLDDCANLIRRIVTTTLQFSIDKKSIGDVEYHLLRENVSKSIFRVMTGDAMLSNSFWNFYLEPSD